MKKGSLAILCGMLIASYTVADDWPQFRGPDRTGVSKEKGLLKAWPKGGPKLAWTYKDAGLGFSSFAVAKGVVYTLGTDLAFDAKGLAFDGKGLALAKDEYVIAIDEKTGKELWRTRIGILYTYKGNFYGDGPRSTPTVDGDFLYALGGQADLVCLDIANKGKEVWRKNLEKDLGGVIMDKYGWSESPLVDGKHLICTPGGPKGTLAALDKTNGNVIWRSAGLTNNAPFSSMVVADIHGVRQYIQTSYHDKPGDIHGEVSGISAANGKVLWTQTIFTNSNDGISASPVVAGNQVYVTAGFGGGCHLFEIAKGQTATEKFSKAMQKKVKNTHGGVVLIDGHIYGHSEPGMWVCQNLESGKVVWDERQTLSCKSGVVTAAEGMLYFYTDDGEVGLVAADPDPAGMKLISSFTPPQKSAIPGNGTSRQSRIWAYPVVANGHLYLRDHEYVFAFKITP
ncbi:MAG: polyvinylalcohol dehydrogenase [Gemmataceae bacterium]|nr:polyvinylalcohol dehydrogenase [Gemmataceae bacterium]